ncbi:ALG14 [Candida jiufengensis]|uniref:ALG14 n=1 Tax=Candida jiufengensis TaxID=497108 RepID=UPI0022243AD0|nr:ALG14 [Candida jiufengensis]KAI5952265.1 ALG14 [Candida jiufengensis]
MSLESYFCLIVFLSSIPIISLFIRLICILPFTKISKSINDSKKSIKPFKGSKISIFLGSGGHTGEMLKLISKLDISDLKTTWIYSSGDLSSINQIKQHNQNAHLIEIPRARKVGQSYLTSIPTTLYSFLISSITLLNHNPKILLLNGPGTCIPIAYILFFYKIFGLNNTKVIYIESLARVNKLSLSGRLIMPIADRFIVQWENLYHQYNRAEYYGILL